MHHSGCVRHTASVVSYCRYDPPVRNTALGTSSDAAHHPSSLSPPPSRIITSPMHRIPTFRSAFARRFSNGCRSPSSGSFCPCGSICSANSRPSRAHCSAHPCSSPKWYVSADRLRRGDGWWWIRHAAFFSCHSERVCLDDVGAVSARASRSRSPLHDVVDGHKIHRCLPHGGTVCDHHSCCTLDNEPRSAARCLLVGTAVHLLAAGDCRCRARHHRACRLLLSTSTTI